MFILCAYDWNVSINVFEILCIGAWNFGYIDQHVESCALNDYRPVIIVWKYSWIHLETCEGHVWVKFEKKTATIYWKLFNAIVHIKQQNRPINNNVLFFFCFCFFVFCFCVLLYYCRKRIVSIEIKVDFKYNDAHSQRWIFAYIFFVLFFLYQNIRRCRRHTELVHSFNQIQAIIDSNQFYLQLNGNVMWWIRFCCVCVCDSDGCTLLHQNVSLLENGFLWQANREPKQCECYAQLIYDWTMDLYTVNFKDFGFRLSVCVWCAQYSGTG